MPANHLKPVMGCYRAPDKSNYNQRPSKTVIDTIIIHYTEVSWLEAYNLLAFNGDVSAHFLIRADGRIDNLVDVKNRAWHAGISGWHNRENVNDFSIGIELDNLGNNADNLIIGSMIETKRQNSFPLAQMQALSNLISYLKKKFPDIKDSNILGHSDIAVGRKIDPGIDFDWGMLQKMGHGIYDFSVPPYNQKILAIGDEGVAVTTLVSNLQKFGYHLPARLTNNIFDLSCAETVRAFQMHYIQDRPVNFTWGVWDTIAETRLQNLLSSRS